MRLPRVEESRDIVREIQIWYFLSLVLMSKTQIHSCFNNIIIDMYSKITVPLGHCLSASDCAGIVSGPYVMSNHECFVDFRQYLFLESASHPPMLRMDAASTLGSEPVSTLGSPGMTMWVYKLRSRINKCKLSCMGQLLRSYHILITFVLLELALRVPPAVTRLTVVRSTLLWGWDGGCPKG